MKKPRTIQTKRTRPKAGFRILHAATRLTKKRKQRAATSAHPEDLGEVPGVGVARGLIVILLLHVAAIAGIYLHNSWSEGSDIEASIPALQENKPPTRLSELRPHTVTSGDNYDKIARKFGVDRDVLMKVNEGKVLEPGWVINIPNNRAEIARPAQDIASHNDTPIPHRSYGQNPRPAIQTSQTQVYEGSRPGALGLVEGAPPEPTERAVLVKPPVRPIVQNRPPRHTQYNEPRRPVEREQARPVATGSRHVVRSGDTLWRIANNNGVSVDALQRANPNVNVSAMKIGTTLIIPSR